MRVAVGGYASVAAPASSTRVCRWPLRASLESMAKTWVLDTETKGTGAHVTPLRPRARGREKELSVTRFKAPPRPPAPPAEATPRLFKVVDVLSGRLLAEDVPAAAAIEALTPLRKAIDARVYVRANAQERWRLLTLAETRALWAFRAAPVSESG
jgi:hypothetical protein